MKTPTWVMALFGVLAVLLGGVAIYKDQEALQAWRERNEAVSKLRQVQQAIQQAIDDQEAKAKAALIESQLAAQQEKEREDNSLATLREQSKEVLAMGKRLHPYGVRIVNNVEFDNGRSRAFLVEPWPAAEANIGGTGVIWCYVFRDGVLEKEQYPEEYVLWVTLQPKDLVERLATLHFDGRDRFKVEDCTEPKDGRIDATIVSLQDGRRWKFWVTRYRYGSAKPIEEAVPEN
jgi:hypothetical protein